MITDVRRNLVRMYFFYLIKIKRTIIKCVINSIFTFTEKAKEVAGQSERESDEETPDYEEKSEILQPLDKPIFLEDENKYDESKNDKPSTSGSISGFRNYVRLETGGNLMFTT